MQINVTEEDIREGKRCNPCECPVARAIKRDLGLTCAVAVQSWKISFGDYWIDTPQMVKDFVNRLDQRYHVEPFSFEFPDDLSLWHLL